jgi:hypothetical protein
MEDYRNSEIKDKPARLTTIFAAMISSIQALKIGLFR